MHYSCSHPEYRKSSIVFSKASCVSEKYSRENYFWGRSLQMRSRFLKRKYPEKLIDNEIKKVSFSPVNLQRKKGENRLFLVTYHSTLISWKLFETMWISIKGMKKLWKISHQDLWSHFKVDQSWALAWLGLNYIHWKEKYLTLLYLAAQ